MSKNVVFVVLMLQMCFGFCQKKVVIIDPGHGGKDSGAIGKNRVLEKDVVLKVAKEILMLNKNLLNDELDIYVTRYTDTLISLSDRARLANQLEADVFISLHCNTAKSNARGIEIFVHNSSKKDQNTSIAFGESILKTIASKLNFENRGMKFANFKVLREAATPIKLLIELGFVSNMDESNYYQDDKNIRAISLAILLEIRKYEGAFY